MHFRTAGKEIFYKQIGYFDSIWTSVEAHIAWRHEEFEHPIFWCNFIVDGHSLEYFYFCKKSRSRSTYKILIKEDAEILFEWLGYY